MPKRGGWRTYKTKAKKCFIYVLAERGVYDVVKVGITTSVERRLKEIQGGNWRALLVKAQFEFDDTSKGARVETKVRIKLSEMHIRGEWFGVDATRAISVIKQAIGEKDEPPSKAKPAELRRGKSLREYHRERRRLIRQKKWAFGKWRPPVAKKQRQLGLFE